MKSQNPINDYVVNLHIYIRIIATRAGKNCAKKVRRGDADGKLDAWASGLESACFRWRIGAGPLTCISRRA
ncbi:hypothetical protein DXC32_08185 [Bifidobacterium longum]|nr:hypothetical protein DXC32_08185 [Bifidobacterium longum]